MVTQEISRILARLLAAAFVLAVGVPPFSGDVVGQGDLADVAAGGAGLRAVDITDPANPVELGAWDSPGYAEGVAVSGNTAYLADGPYGLWTVDVSDPAHPQKTGAADDMNNEFEGGIDWGD